MDFMIFECFKLNDAEGTVLDIGDLLNTADPSKGIHVLGYEAGAGLKALQVLRGAVACCRHADTGHALDSEADSVVQMRRATAPKLLYQWCKSTFAAQLFLLRLFCVPFWSDDWTARPAVVNVCAARVPLHAAVKRQRDVFHAAVKRQRDVFRLEKACRACTSKVMVVG